MVPRNEEKGNDMISSCPRRLRLLVSRHMMVPLSLMQEVMSTQQVAVSPSFAFESASRSYAVRPVMRSPVEPKIAGKAYDQMSLSSWQSMQSDRSVRSYHSVQVAHEPRHHVAAYQHPYSPGTTSSIGRKQPQPLVFTPPTTPRNVPGIDQCFTQQNHAPRHNPAAFGSLSHYASVPDFSNLPGHTALHQLPRTHQSTRKSAHERPRTVAGNALDFFKGRPRAATASGAPACPQPPISYPGSFGRQTTSTSSEVCTSSTSSSTVPPGRDDVTMVNAVSNGHPSYPVMTDGPGSPAIMVTEEPVVERSVPVQTRAPRDIRENTMQLITPD